MRASGKDAAIGLLLIAAVIGLSLAWVQTRHVRALQRQIDRYESERDELQDQLVESRRANAAIQAQLARARPATALTGENSTASDASSEPATARGTFALRGIGAVTGTPEFQQAFLAGIKSNLDLRYASLFRRLRLPPAELEKLKNLLVDRQAVAFDAFSASRSNGVGPAAGDEMRALIEQSQAEIDQSIRALIGDRQFAQYQDFQQHAGTYALADQLERRLSYTDSPLLPEQADELVRMLIDSVPPAAAPGPVPLSTGAISYRSADAVGNVIVSTAGGQGMITDDVIERAQEILTPAQIDALRELQAEQQAMARIAGPGRGAMFRAVPVPPP